jgi:alpha-glucoside transport system permease protein
MPDSHPTVATELGGLTAPVRPPTSPETLIPAASSGRRVGRRELAFGGVLLTPAIVVLGALVVYPVFATVVRSFYGREGGAFVGLDNYREIASRDTTRHAIANNLFWVAVAPIVVTAVGLVFAVFTQRVRFGTAFKIIVFMPMAISFLAAGVIARLVYEQDPDRGLANAVATTITGLWDDDGPYVNGRPSGDALRADGRAFVTSQPVSTGNVVLIGLVGLRAEQVPDSAAPAVAATPAPGAINGTVWLDFSAARGERGRIDATERGLPNMAIAAKGTDGRVVARTNSGDDGTFTFAELPAGSYNLELTPSNFHESWQGWAWLGDTDVTPVGPAIVTLSIIFTYVWIWAGFAMVVIAAGLAAIPTEVQEAARVDGAGEWQVFRKVTVPLLWPVLLVVVVTLVINVLKIFDLVLIIPPGSSQNEASVIALEQWRVSFGGARDEGLGSALAVLLFLLVIPFMAWNIRRFRTEQR